MPFLLIGLLVLGGFAAWELSKPQAPSGPVTVTPGQLLNLNVPVGTTFTLQPPAASSFSELTVNGPVNEVVSINDASGNFLNVGTYRVVAAGSAQIVISFSAGAAATVNVTAS
jgi:hypothetical protein